MREGNVTGGRDGLALRLARRTVALRRQIMAIALLFAVVGAFGVARAHINYDLLSYLPEDLQSVEGFELISDEFGLGNTAQILLVGTSDIETERLTDELRAVDGVDAVQWVTDLTDLEVPREFRDSAVESNYYAGDATFVQVSLSAGGNDPAAEEAFAEIKRVLADEEAYVTGSQQVELKEVMSSDQVKFAIVAVVLVSVVLLLTIPSIVVPLTFVFTIGLAVLYNLGLAYYIGQDMSYITGVIVIALQFAVTMDYALLLYHRFAEERAAHDAEEAMAIAVASSGKSIAAAATTTIAGFAALSVMKLGFGVDMGLTLARGVAITLIAVMTVLPALILLALPVIDRVSHRVPKFDFSKLGRFIGKHAVIFTLAGLVLFVPAIWGYTNVVLDYDLDRSLPADLPSVVASERIAEAFGRKATVFLVVEDRGRMVELERLVDDVDALDGVTNVFAYTSLVDARIPAEFVPSEARKAFFSGGYTYLSIDLAHGFGDEALQPTLDAVRETAEAYGGKTYLTGQAVLIKDMEAVSAGDAERINILSVVAIFVIVAVAFRSFSVPVALLGVIELAILLNQAIATAGGRTLMFVAALAIGAIQLGATVDYAIMITGRYEEELARTKDRREAITRAVGGSSQSILVSAATMFAATIGMAVMSSVGIIGDLTMLIARGAIISFFVVVFLLPALLVVGQPLFARTSLGWPKETVKDE